MVFESIVADLLNKYLGKYVENLDASQLKIGIWGVFCCYISAPYVKKGNVVLEHLHLKDTALDDLDLPVKVVKGYLGKLTLAIPWKNLYQESTSVNIEDLHVLAKPNFDIKYNEEKEEKAKKEKKRLQIENIEEARRLEEERKLAKKDKQEEQDSFAEKLGTNVIKNLQITIKNIHVRYEDSISDDNSPFSIGITLQNLSAQTTDENFVPKIIKESVTIIHKLVRLDNLAVYWNPRESFKEQNMQEWLENSRNQIATPTVKPTNMKYLLKPLVASKTLKINTKPGLDTNIPKVFLNVALEELGIILLRGQYHGLVQLLESFERMSRNIPFRKYRPSVPLKGNTGVWWHYCINSMLEEDVRRRARMWSWEHIRKHRLLCKNYKLKYREKLLQKNPGKALLAILEEMEDELNVASITIFRQLAECEVSREKKLKKDTKEGGFFSSFFSSSKSKNKKPASKIEELMGSEKEAEMQKLYEAIGYTENEVITAFPKEYVATVFRLSLKRISITIRDDSLKRSLDVVRFTLDDISLDLNQRPSAKGLRVHTTINAMKLFGTKTEDEVPLMIRNISQGDEKGQSLVDLTFEMNPLNKENIDQLISAVFQPLEIIYDANSINKVIKFFEPPKDVILQDLQEKAYTTFEDFRESSTAGLLYAIEQRNIVELNIHVSASYLIIPEKGSIARCNNMLVVNFGSFHMESDPCQIRIINPKDIENIEEVQKNAYDKFLLKMSDVQILLCREGDDLQTALAEQKSDMHLLRPIAFEGQISKAIVSNDPRLKQMVISGTLSSIEVYVSDDKISRAYKIFDSLPLPEFGSSEPDQVDSTPSRKLSRGISLTDIAETALFGSKSLTIPKSSEGQSQSDETLFHTPPDSESILRLDSVTEPSLESAIANQINIELDFKVEKLKLAVAVTDKILNSEKECMEFSIENVAATVIMRRWDMFVDASIGRFLLAEMTWGEPGVPLYLVSTPKDENMLQVSYRKFEFDQMMTLGPSYLYSAEAQVRALHYKDEFGSTQQTINVKAAMMNVILHQEALLSVMALVQQILEPLAKEEEKPVSTLKRGLESMGSRLELSIGSRLNLAKNATEVKVKKRESKTQIAANELKEKVGVSEEVQIAVTADMAGVTVIIQSDACDLARASLKDLSSTVHVKESQMEIKAGMKELQIIDDCKETQYKEIVSMTSDQVFDLELIVFTDGTKGHKALNMSNVDTSVKASIGQVRAVFLNRFVIDIFNFIDNFEDAKKAVMEAGKAASEKAAAAMSEFSRHASRNLLNIVIRAPTIIVPVNSLSDLALMFDLGELRLFNNFKLLNREKGVKGAIVTDNITIRLTELKLLKSLIKNGKDILAQRAMVEPVTLTLNVIRNLTFGNHSIPDIGIKGALHTVSLSLSEEDVSVALRIIYGNIAEGNAKLPKKKKQMIKDPSAEDILTVPEQGKDRLASIYEEPSDSENIYENTTFEFDLEKVQLKLYLKPPDMTFEEEFLERVDQLLLSQFIIGNLNVKGNILSDNSMSVKLFLETLILDDLRPSSQETLTRMMDCFPEPLVKMSGKFAKSAPSNKMIEIEYSQTSQNDKNIEISVNNLLTILNFEFIMVLVRTLQAIMPKEEEEENISPGGSPTHSITSTDEEVDTSIGELNVTIVSDDVVPPETRMQLYVKNPQIVFLADAKDIKTNALFLTTDVNFQYLELNNAQKMMGSITSTAVVSTAFKEEHRTDTSPVLTLDTVNLHSSAPLGGKQHVHISTTLIKMDISPKTIRTLSACATQTASVPDKSDIRQKQKAMKELWHIRDITNKHMWYLQTPPPQVLSAGSFVLARKERGFYHNGFLSKSDTHFLVFFYPEGSVSHSVSDVTSVIVDMVPNEEDLLVGENVLAVQTGEERYQPGRIMEIWKGTNQVEVAQEASQEGGSEEDWEATQKNNDDPYNKYLVKFYHDSSEKYFVSEELRLLPRPIKNIVPGLGACVYARFSDGFYYRGFIEKLMDFKVRVGLEEISNEVQHDRYDPSAVILNMTPRESQIKKYFKVIAQKGEGIRGYHPGKVAAIQGNAGFRSYTIRFEDGSVNQVPVTRLLLMPKAPHDALPEVGTYVYSRVARDAPLYEKGIVADKDKDRIYVKHLNGRKLAHDRQNISFVLRNIVPLTSSLKIGQDVIGQVDNDDMKMYMGAIKEVVQGSKTKKYIVQFTDGSRKKLTPGKIRILTTFGSTADVDAAESNNIVARKEQMIIEVEGISLSVQEYLGGLLTPVLRFDLRLYGEVSDWSSLLKAYATVSLSGKYFNEKVAEWEPLIEPIVNGNRERPWQLAVNYVTEDDNVTTGDDKMEEIALSQKPMTSLSIQSNENLEITVTKAGLTLLTDLGQIFEKAVASTDIVQNIVFEKDPFVIFNEIGKSVTIRLDEYLQDKEGRSELKLEKSSSIALQYKSDRGETYRYVSQIKEKLPIICVKVDGYKEIKNIIVKRQRIVIYDLIAEDILNSKGSYSMVIDVKATDGQRNVTIRTPLQIANCFPVPLDVSYLNNQGVSMKLTTIEADSKYSVPLIPTYHASFRIKPGGFGYKESSDLLSWSELARSPHKQLICAHPDGDTEPFLIQVVATVVQYTSIHGMIEAVPRYTIHCHPPIIMHNYLPYPISYRTQGMAIAQKLEGGSSWPLYNINYTDKPILDLKLENYLGCTWTGSIALSGCKENETTRMSTFYLRTELDNRQMPKLEAHYLRWKYLLQKKKKGTSSKGKEKENSIINGFLLDFLQDFCVYSSLEGSLHVTLYASYWMLNKTGKSLVYQATGSSAVHEHLHDEDGALMFHVRGKKKKARVCVLGCSWSDEFPIDTIGSGGSLKSVGIRDRVFEIGVGISVSYFGLTKLVTFTPLRNLTNHTQVTISMAEHDSSTAEWHTVKPGESVPYWPTCLPPANLYLNINGINSAKFNPAPGKTLLLKFQNEIGGVCVNYQEKDSSSLLSFSPYFDGAAPVRVENLCKKISMISYKQSTYATGYVLTYGQSIIYTWDDPTKPHELICAVIECAESQKKIKLDANDFGRMKTGDDAIYFVSFLDGLQRVLLFTDDFKTAYCASQEQTLRPTQEINVNLEGLGLSLVNSEKRMEIGYLGIQKSKVVWEKFTKRWKTLSGRLCEALDVGYENYSRHGGPAKEKIDNMEVDFEKMFITRPERMKIRRTFHSGLEFKYIISPNRMQIRTAISSIQLDSHVPGSTFMTVIHEVEPPKSVTNDNALKPFFEMSLTTNVNDKNLVSEISYFKVLVQEMDIKVDKGFLLALMELLGNEKLRGNERERYEYDMTVVKQKLEDSPEFQAARQDKRYVFDYFHLSPLKIHVSFSMTGGHALENETSSSSMPGNVLSLLLQSVGVAFTEIQDVEFKLACFEVETMLMSNTQLTDHIYKHYYNQAIKQLYVLVLGLDVLGNPYGLITGVGAGAKNFFYEPYQGLIQGPEEFAEGLAYGVKSLVGGTLGGVSGAVSKITGTVGKGLAALTLDDEYQQKRRQQMSQRPTNVGQGLLKGGKGLAKGIVSGVTGVVVKPYQGAKNEGASGFFKGIGKGLIGVVARPAGGVVDMASSTFEGIKSTTAGVNEVKPLRVERVFHADKVLRPFNEYEANGNKILKEVDKGRYAKTDFYVIHIQPVDKKNVLILTNRNVLYVHRSEILRDWECLWRLGFNDIKGDPVVSKEKVTFDLHSTLTITYIIINDDVIDDVLYEDFMHASIDVSSEFAEINIGKRDMLSDYEQEIIEMYCDEDGRRSVFKKSVSSRTVSFPKEELAKWFVEKLDGAKML